jgi:hypothetical protein
MWGHPPLVWQLKKYAEDVLQERGNYTGPKELSYN